MRFPTSRDDRISQLVALCVKNDLTPRKNAFAGKIRDWSSMRFGCSERTAKDYATTINNAWTGDRWKNFVAESEYLTEEEKQAWIAKI